jgi:hypothetical protein
MNESPLCLTEKLPGKTSHRLGRRKSLFGHKHGLILPVFQKETNFLISNRMGRRKSLSDRKHGLILPVFHQEDLVL